MLDDFLMFSFAPMLIGLFIAITCAILGNFLLLRKQALVSDSISHVVLPGIVLAFVVTGSAATWPMMIGAGVAALLSVAFIEVIVRFGRIEPSAAMGVVFTSMFALGVLLLELSDTRNVHLDVQHALYGSLESLIWLDAVGWRSLLDPVALAGLPHELWRVLAVFALVTGAIIVFWRHFVLISFDETFAASAGVHVGLVSIFLISLSAIAAVAAFDAVGSIIVIAMFVCPPATARLLTNRLKTQVALSVLFASLSVIIGILASGYVLRPFGYTDSVSAAGMIAVISGILLAASAVFGKHRLAVN